MTTALQGVWECGEAEFEEWEAGTETVGQSTEKDIFCQGYLFGCAFGLSLSCVRPDLAKKFFEINERWAELFEAHRKYLLKQFEEEINNSRVD